MFNKQLHNILDDSVYEKIVQQNDMNTDLINKALSIVEKYIIKTKKVLVGGMAIDMALRKKGSKIYDDDEIPDYDFVSPIFHIDAYNIANLLFDANLPNISVINALHPSTMRVRINFITVADCTYIPKRLYNKLPTLNYKNFKIIHPSIQFTDQHRSLSFPYENPPRETIMFRWEKDIKRHELLYNKYPLPFEKTPKKPIDYISYKLDTKDLNNQCIGGFAALIFWVNMAQSMGYKLKNVPSYTKGEINKKNIDITIPLIHGFTIFSDNLFEYIEKLNTKKHKVKWYNGILDKLPRKTIVYECKGIPKWELFDNKGSMISAFKYDNIWITNLQYIMEYSLTYYFIYNFVEKNKDYVYEFYTMYLTCKDIFNWAVKCFSEKNDEKYLVFLPTPETYGNSNWAESYLLSKKQFKIQLEDTTQSKIVDKPKRAYPEVEKIDISLYSFDPEKSSIYQFDGLKTNKFNPLILPD